MLLGPADWTIFKDIGQVGFKGLMEEAGLCEHDVAQMRMLIDRKDFIGIEEIVGR